MKHYLIYRNTTGQVLRSGTMQTETPLSSQIFAEDEVAMELSEPLENSQGVYVDLSNTPTVAAFPTKPSDYHTWDSTTLIWVEDIDALRRDKIAKIKEKMLTLKFSPISYDDKLVDADETAILNINGKMQEIAASESLGLSMVNLVWRDHNNTTHSWESATAYKAWLQGLVVAISQRGTSLYGISWAKQAEINSLSSMEDLQNYDIDLGWL
ncbi:MAG: hypothetical protein IBX56_19800 [Methylomicrobium sp.]|nr:hypothetical protein [Methylomicrobium sp.]